MPALRQTAERHRLARLLEVPPERVDFLKSLDSNELASLYEACRRALVDAHRPLFQRLARSSHLLPAALSAWIAEHTLGPLLAARISDEMSVPATLALCQHLSPAFMAEVTLHMDLERLDDIALALPLENIHAVTHELLARGEYMMLGELVDRMPAGIVEAVTKEIRATEGLLRTSLFIREPARLMALLGQLPPAAIGGLVQAAADPAQGLMPHGLFLLQRATPAWQRRLIDTALVEGRKLLTNCIREVQRLGLWASAVPLVALMDSAARRQLLALPVWAEDAALLANALRQAADPRLRPHVLGLLAELSPAAREQALAMLAQANAGPPPA